MKNFKQILRTLAIMSTGTVASSLLFTKTDNWKFYLVLTLLCITLERWADNEEN